MYFTLSQAAKESGKSKSVISKALKDGTMSFVSKDDSGYQIDPAELFRVFPREPVLERDDERSRTPDRTGENGPENAQRLNVLEVENKLLHERIKDKDERITELREDRDRWQQQASRLALTFQPSAEDAQSAAEEKHTPEAPRVATEAVHTSERSKMPLYATLLVMGMAITAVMNMFEADIRTWLQRMTETSAHTTKREAAPQNASKNGEGTVQEPTPEPQQSFPPVRLPGTVSP